MANVYINEIPNTPSIQEMPLPDYKSIPNIRHAAIDMSVDFSKHARALQQEPLPGGFKRGSDIVAGAMASGVKTAGVVGEGIQAVGQAFGTLSKMMENMVKDQDAVAEQHAHENRQMFQAKYEAETAGLPLNEKMEWWNKNVPGLQEMNSSYGTSRLTRDKIASQDSAFGVVGGYKIQAEVAKKGSQDAIDYAGQTIQKGIDEPTPENTSAAHQANETAHQRQWINDAKFQENEDKLTTATRKTTEIEAMNKDPWKMRDDTDKLMKGEEPVTKEFSYLKDNPERARALNQAAKAQINAAEQEGAETYQDELTKNEIKFEDREKRAKELHVRPKVADSINKDADVPDPNYNPKVANHLDTRLQKFDPAKMDPDKLADEVYAIKDEIRQMPRAHRAEYADRLNDRLERHKANKPIEAADKMLGDFFDNLEKIDTGEKGSLFGWDGTNGKTGEKMKIEDLQVFQQHQANITAIKQGMRLFVAKKPDATQGDLRQEYNRLAKEYIETPANKQTFEQAKLPAPQTSAEAIAVAQKKFKERTPPTSIPTQPTTGAGYVTPAGKSEEAPSTGLGPGGYPIRQEIPPEGSGGSGAPTPLSFAPGATYSQAIAGGARPGKLVPKILGSDPLPQLDYGRMARQALGVEPIPRAEFVGLPGLEREAYAAQGTPAPMKVTAYVPGKGGIEGKNEVASRSGPAYTVEDFREGKVPHVSVAMDPKSELQGKYLRSTDPEYEGIVFKVEDTGSAFKGKGSGAIDVAFRDPAKAKNYGKNADFVAIGNDEAVQIASNRKQALPYGRLERQAAGVEAAPGATVVKQAVDPKHPAMTRARDVKQISKIVVHGDVRTDVDGLIEYSKSADKGYHYYIALDGTVTQAVPDDRKAYHIKGANSDSIGIILVGADNGKQPTAAQDKAAKKLISELGRKYGIDPKNVAGHGERQPDRRHPEEGGHVARDIREQGFI